MYQVQRNDAAMLRWNNTEWQIEGFAKPTYWIRFVNAGAFGANTSSPAGGWGILATLLWWMKRSMVTPALDRSLQLMREAEQQQTVTPLVCNKQARTAMRTRITNYYLDICETPSITYFGKLLLYYQASIDLYHHYCLLSLGMQLGVQEEVIKEPVFIVSFPRTGTTILHRTMTQDTTKWKCLDMCDMFLPILDPTNVGVVPRWDVQGRKTKSDKVDSILWKDIDPLFPGYLQCMATMHEFQTDQADESLNSYDPALGHHYLDPLMKLYPMYRNNKQRYPSGTSPEVESNDTALYRYAWLKMTLQIYQYTDETVWRERNGGGNNNDRESPTKQLTWLLKDPDHSVYMTELMTTFPDCKVIYSHRNIVDICPSVGKVFEIFGMMDAVPETPGTSSQDWGIEINRRLQRYCTGIIAFTKKVQQQYQQQQQDNDDNTNNTTDNNSHGRHCFDFQYTRTGDTNTDGIAKRRVDFQFMNLVTDIPGAIETIYAQFYPSSPLQQEIKQKLVDYLIINHREKNGNQKHRSLQQLHLTEEMVTNTEYNRMFLQPFQEDGRLVASKIISAVSKTSQSASSLLFSRRSSQ